MGEGNEGLESRSVLVELVGVWGYCMCWDLRFMLCIRVHFLGSILEKERHLVWAFGECSWESRPLEYEIHQSLILVRLSDDLVLHIVFLLNYVLSSRLIWGKLLREKESNARLTRFFQYNTTRRSHALLNEAFTLKKISTSFKLFLQKTHTYCISHFLTLYIFIRIPFP